MSKRTHGMSNLAQSMLAEKQKAAQRSAPLKPEAALAILTRGNDMPAAELEDLLDRIKQVAKAGAQHALRTQAGTLVMPAGKGLVQLVNRAGGAERMGSRL